jgi:hypothetical protein
VNEVDPNVISALLRGDVPVWYIGIYLILIAILPLTRRKNN